MKRLPRIGIAAAVLALASPGRALAVAGTQAPATQVSSPVADSAELRSVRRLLDPKRRAGRPNAELVRDLVAIGPRAAPVFVAILSGALPGTDWEESGLTLEELHSSDGGEETILTEALRGLPPGASARAISAACAGDAPLDKRLVGLHLLAEVGQGAESVKCWHELAGPVEEIHLKRAYVRAQLETALARCLERSPASFEPLTRSLRGWEPKLLPAVVHACMQARRRQGVEVLSGLRGQSRALDLELLANMPTLAAATIGGLSEAQVAWIRGFSTDADPDVRCSAVIGLGRACDPGSADALLDALGDADERVSQAALWSLMQISGTRLSSTREEWTSWLRAEQRWWEESRARWIQELGSTEPARVVEALHQLSLHPLFRHENALAILGECESQDPAVLRSACAVLQRLDSMSAADTLVRLLARPEAEVRAAAHQALVAISGRKLEPQPELWLQALGS